MTTEEFNRTGFTALTKVLLIKWSETKLVVGVNFEESLIATLVDDLDKDSITWNRCENCEIVES